MNRKRTPPKAAKEIFDAATRTALEIAIAKIDEVLEAIDLPVRDAEEHAEILKTTARAALSDVVKQIAFAKADARRHRLLAIAEHLREARAGASDEIERGDAKKGGR